MAAGTFQFYDATAKFLLGGADFTTATVKVAIVTSSYTPNQDTDDAWADVSSNEISSTNTGYTTGGYALQSTANTETTKGFFFDSADPTWTAGSANLPAHRYYVMYISGTVEGITNPLIGYFLGDSTPADVPATTTGNTLTVTVPAAGWFDVTRP
jgi:hypothetical protein